MEESLLELRNRMKRKKPHFIRQDFHKKRLKKKWLKPSGLHSKVILKKGGHPKPVSTGYGSPKDVRGLSKEGLKVIIIHNKDELDKVNKEKEGIIISKNVSKKNKILLLKKTKEKDIKVLNLNVGEYLKKEEEKKKKAEEKKISKKEKDKEEKKEKLEEKVGKEESEEEKRNREKKEMDKLLIQKS